MISFLIYLLMIFTTVCTSHGAPFFIGDTLKPGESLNSSTFMVSPSGEYTLGFDSSGFLALKSDNHTLWVANVNYPIADTSSALLTLDEFTTLLQITQGKNPTIDIFFSPFSSTNVVATLTDSGNFVLQDKGLNTSNSPGQMRVLWQSFDDTNVAIIAGMKLRDARLNDSYYQKLENSTGIRSYALDWYSGYTNYSGQLFIYTLVKDGSLTLVWRSGGLSRSGKFQHINIPDESKAKYNFSLNTVDSEDYLSYHAFVGGQEARSALVLHTNGELFDVYNNISIVRAGDCDGINNEGGCQTWGDGSMNDSLCDYITTSSNNKSEVLKRGSFVGKSLNISHLDFDEKYYGVYGLAGDCKSVCTLNCDCLGFDFLFDNRIGCRYWSIRHSRFVEDSTSSTIGFVLPRKPRKKSKGKLNRWIWVGVSVAIVLLALVLCNMYYLIRRRKLAGENRRMIQDMLNMMNSNRPTDAHGLQNDGKRGHDLSVFKYASIVAATCNFSEENKLGQGGFGSVYKGKLVTGEEVAVKRLSTRSGQGVSEFKNELILIYELQHTNLVQLFGFCIHGEERMLIYEYLPNKSLDYFLFDSTRCRQLDWNRRFNIIYGITQGLLYLHKYSRTRIIHRDLKASNVLLDEMMNPKISDFGMARIFTNDEQEAQTMNIAGTRGYMSPEYVMGGNFSIKSDVYSFGVLMLEILSGRRNNSFYNDDRAINLVGYAWVLWKQGDGLGLMDPTIAESCDAEKTLRCIHVALLCVEENASDRPIMLDVISMLTNERMSLPEPTKPAFCTENNVIARVAIDGNGPEVVASINDISISDFNGR